MNVELGNIYLMVKNEGIFVHPEKIKRAQIEISPVKSTSKSKSPEKQSPEKVDQIKKDIKETKPKKKIVSKGKEDIFFDPNIIVR